MTESLPQFQFDNRFVEHLPADPIVENRLRQVYGASYSRVQPTPVSAPKLLIHSPEMAEVLGWSRHMQQPWMAEALAGNRLLAGMDPHATCYGGHQFGNWAGQLGDGRAIGLGALNSTDGQNLELQLKGAGPTPYSRRADGRAVLRSSLREFMCSEAMHHLGIATTRALSLVATGDDVVRDILYSGDPQPEPGAIVCRVSPSFIRFGNFELLAQRDEPPLLRKLCKFVIESYYGPLAREVPEGPERVVSFFEEVGRRTVDTVIGWLRVGFVHGVMNTDNMSILGLTIDYGPYGWVDDYDERWTPNTTDLPGRRYCFGAQLEVALWNLSRLGSALAVIFDDPAPLQAALERTVRFAQSELEAMWTRKLGLSPNDERPASLIAQMRQLLQTEETDMTIFFRRLADVELGPNEQRVRQLSLLGEAAYDESGFSTKTRGAWGQWLADYEAALAEQRVTDSERRRAMNQVNPNLVLRNYLAQELIDAAQAGDIEPTQRLFQALKRPYSDASVDPAYTKKRPDWARHRPGCSQLSCSS